MELELDRIEESARTQMRVREDDQTVEEYASVLRDGGELPPATVFFVDGERYLLGGGYHRLRAYRRVGRQTMPVEVRVGTERDAFIFALGANARHGLRRTREDKRRAVTLALQDDEIVHMTVREIADLCGVSHGFVGGIRQQLENGGQVASNLALLHESTQAEPIEVPPPPPPIPEGAYEDPGPPPPEVEESYDRARDQGVAVLREIEVACREAAAVVRGLHVKLERVVTAGVDAHGKSPVMPETLKRIRSIAAEWKWAGGLAAACEEGVYAGVCEHCGGEGCPRCQNLGWQTVAQRGRKHG